MEFKEAKKIVINYYVKKLKEFNALEYLVKRFFYEDIRSISKLLKLLEKCDYKNE